MLRKYLPYSYSLLFMKLSKCGCYYYCLLLLWDIRFHGPWQRCSSENCKSAQEATYLPHSWLLPPFQYYCLKNEEVTKEAYPKSLIKESPFIKSKDCWADIQGTKLHGGCDDRWPAGCLSIAKKNSNSSHIGSCIRPLENVPGHKPHRITKVSGFWRDLIFYLGKKLEELLLAMVVRPTDEVVGVWVIGSNDNSCSHRAIIFPDVKVFDNRNDDVPHFIKSLLSDTVGLVQGEYQLCRIHWTLFYKNEKQKY